VQERVHVRQSRTHLVEESNSLTHGTFATLHHDLAEGVTVEGPCHTLFSCPHCRTAGVSCRHVP